MMMLTLFLAFLFHAHAERPVAARDGVLTLGSEFSFFHSSSNYREDGSTKTLLNGASFDNGDLNLRLGYELAHQWRISTTFDYAQTRASDGTTPRSQQGLNEASLGAQYWLNAAPFYIVPQFQFRYPFWHVNENSDRALIGEGLTQIEGGAWWIWRLEPFQPFAYIGYTYRDAGKSALLPYSLGLHWRPSRFWLEASWRGSTSVSADSDAGNRGLRDVFLTRVSGGSYRFDAINPSLNEAVLQAGFHFRGGLNLYAGVAQTLAGHSSANGWTATGGLILTQRMSEQPVEETTTTIAKPETKFEPQQEKYDESLFQETPTSKPKVRRKVRKGPSLDKLLNETEKELSQ